MQGPMAESPYLVTPARIGNSSDLRLPASFYRELPDPQDQEAEENNLMLALFLDFLNRQAFAAKQDPMP